MTATEILAARKAGAFYPGRVFFVKDVNNVAIVRGAFSQLLQPGRAKLYPGKIWFIDTKPSVMEQGLEDELMNLYPDTSKTPRWRQPPRQHEAPIKAFRCWGMAWQDGGWVLTSAAMRHTIWEGPVIRADYPPIDPKVWDKAKREGSPEVRNLTEQVFTRAGIHALKTLEQADEAAAVYAVACYGEVDLWGRVAQFELGFRAEYCMIKKLYLIKRMVSGKDREIKRVVSDLSSRYQCDVELA